MPAGNAPSLRFDRPPPPRSSRGLAILGPRQLHVTGQYRVRRPPRGSRGRRGNSAPGRLERRGRRRPPCGALQSSVPARGWGCPIHRLTGQVGSATSTRNDQPMKVPGSGRLKHPPETPRDAPPTPCPSPPPSRADAGHHQIPSTHRSALLKARRDHHPPHHDHYHQHLNPSVSIPSPPLCTALATRPTTKQIPPRTHFACLPHTESDADPFHSQS